MQHHQPPTIDHRPLFVVRRLLTVDCRLLTISHRIFCKITNKFANVQLFRKFISKNFAISI